MAAELEPSGRGFLDSFVPIGEPPHADYLVDDPLFKAHCGDYPSCVTTAAIGITTMFLSLSLLAYQWNSDQVSGAFFGFERIRWLTRKVCLLATFLMAGWFFPLMGQYGSWQFWNDLLLFNCSACLIFCFTAVWYEYFALSWEVHRIPPMKLLTKVLWWAPSVVCFIFFNVHLAVSAMTNYVWPRVVLYWVVGPIGVTQLVVGWVYTCQLTRRRRRPAEDYIGTLYKKFRLIARLHYTVVWGSLILGAALAGLIVRVRNLDQVGYYDHYFSLYLDDTLFHFFAAVFQGCGLLLCIYAGWNPGKSSKYVDK